MSHTRGTAKTGFKVQVFDYNNKLYAEREGFANHIEADAWAQARERDYMNNAFCGIECKVYERKVVDK